MSVLGLIMSSPPYLRSAMVRFPLGNPSVHRISLPLLGNDFNLISSNCYLFMVGIWGWLVARWICQLFGWSKGWLVSFLVGLKVNLRKMLF